MKLLFSSKAFLSFQGKVFSFAHCFGSFASVEKVSMMFPVQIVSYVAGPDLATDVTGVSRGAPG
jgi:hypothetical protein